VLSVQEVFENHRVVFTVGTSIASVLTAWAGTLIFPNFPAVPNLEFRLQSVSLAHPID
jgi:hypothetical protein